MTVANYEWKNNCARLRKITESVCKFCRVHYSIFISSIEDIEKTEGLLRTNSPKFTESLALYPDWIGSKE